MAEALTPLLNTADLMRYAITEPVKARRELTASVCADSLYEFVRRAWHVLEPATPMVDGWCMRAICDALQAVTEGRVKRLLVNCPPGVSKTMLLNVMWPAWEWGPRRRPHYRYISAGYELGLPTMAMIRCRDLVLSRWYQSMWPIDLKEDANEKTFYGNTSTGWRKAASVGGALIGYRGDRIIVDDPHDVKRAESFLDRQVGIRWWTRTVPTRLNDPERSVIVLIQQRLHVGDLSGHVIANDHAGEWTKLILPMEFEPSRRCVIPEIGFRDPRAQLGELLWPERFTPASVASMKRAFLSHGGSYAVAGQLQQRPIPESGGLFKRACATVVDSAPAEGVRCRGWDLAASHGRGDYTAGVKLLLAQDGRIYVEDVVRLQGSPLEVERAIKTAAERDGRGCAQSLPQDPGQAGVSQRELLARLLHGHLVHLSRESGRKEDRARPLACQWESGNVLLVRGAWCEAFLDEMELFPDSDFKDQADASSRAYWWLLNEGRPQGGLVGGQVFDLTS